MDKKQRARELRKSGMSYAKIGAALGVVDKTISNLLFEKPGRKCKCEYDSKPGWCSGLCPRCIKKSRQSRNEKGCRKCKLEYDSDPGWNSGLCPKCVSNRRQFNIEKGCVHCKCEYDSEPGWAHGRCPKCNMSSKYGVSRDQFDQLPSSCQICGGVKNLHVDHCHSSGLIRGRLCRSCNTGLGNFGDTLEGLEKAIEYLKASPFQFTPREPQ